MQRYFVPSEQWNDAEVMITGDDVHHLARVMRAKEDDRIIVSDGEKRAVIAVIQQIEPNKIIAKIEGPLEESSESEIDVWIAQSLPKGDKLETVIQKCTELGAAKFIPFTSKRTVVRYDENKLGKKTERWQKIAKEAAEQSHRSIVPEVEAAVSWNQLLKRVTESGRALVCYEQEQGQSLKRVLQNIRHNDDISKSKVPIIVIVGPEGGFSTDEVKQAEEAGCMSVGLGRRILRTETAAMAALSCIMYEFDQMEG